MVGSGIERRLAWVAPLLLAACTSKPLPPPVSGVPVAPPAAVQALAVLADGSRGAAVRSLLKTGYGYEGVEVVAGLAPEAVAARVAALLSRPGSAEERRLIWVNGTACPDAMPEPHPAAVTTVMLVPACFLRLVRAEAAVRRIDLAATGSDPDSKPKEAAVSGTALAVLVLPEGDEAARAAETVVAATLARRAPGPLVPAQLLEAMRAEFRLAGSAYTPVLQVSPPEAAAATGLLPAGTGPVAFAVAAGAPLSTVTVRGAAVELFPLADAAGPPGLKINARYPLQVVRRGPEARMLYVRTRSGHFGWVDANSVE